jgi:hypothetical protein
MLTAEDLLLLLIDDETGKPIVERKKLDHALAGALLIELAIQGRVDIADRGERVRKGRLIVRDPSLLGDELVNDALQVVSAKEGSKPVAVLERLGKGLRDRLLNRLADRGILRREEGRILGLFPTRRWPTADSRHETEIRMSLQNALVNGHPPDQRTGALISLLLAVDGLRKVIDTHDRRALKRRAKEIADGAWAAEAVRSAVKAVDNAVIAAVVGASVATSSNSS